MNFRTTGILFGLVLAFGLVFLLLNQFSEDAPPTGALVEELDKAGVKVEQVETVEIERGTPPVSIKFNRVGKDNWQMTEPASARAEASAVESIINALYRVRPTASADLSSNPAVHGLAPPSLRVTLRAAGKSSTISVGDISLGGKTAFMFTSARPRPMAVPASELSALFKDALLRNGGSAGDLAKGANEYRVKQVFAVDSRTGGDDVTAIKLTSKGKELSLTKSTTGWQFTNPAGWGDAATTGELSSTNPSAITGVRALLNTVVNLSASASEDFLDKPGDPKEYGLNPDHPDLIRVELKEKDGVAEVAFIGKKQDAPAPPAIPGGPIPPLSPAKYYVKLEGSNSVVRVNPPPTMDGLIAAIANPDPLRDRDLVKDSDKNRFDAIDLTVGGQVTKLRKSGGQFGKWQLYGGPNDPQDANPEVVRKLLDLVTHSHVVKDFPATNDANFTPAETRAEIKLWADGIKAIDPKSDSKVDPKAEPKVEGPPLVLQFGKKDAEGIYVRRTLPTGVKSDVRLPEKAKIGGSAPPPPPSPFGAPPPPPSMGEEVDVVAAIARTRLDFLDTSLKGFSQFQANKLTIQNSAVVTEVTFDKTPDMPHFPSGKWKYAKPDAQKDRIADAGTVSDLLTMLSTETVVKFVSEVPSDADLAKWGLDPKSPKLKVTVGLDAGPPPLVGTPPDKEKDKDKERIYSFGNETDDKQLVYAQQEGKTAVFTVRKLTAEKFSTADLRDKTVVRFDRAKVKKVSLRGWKEKSGVEVELVFEKKDGKWVETKSQGKYDVDPAKLDKFLDAVNGLRAKAFLPGPLKPEYKLVPEANGLEVKLELDGAPGIVLFVGASTDAEASLFVQTSTLPANENVITVVSDVFKAYKDAPGVFAK